MKHYPFLLFLMLILTGGFHSAEAAPTVIPQNVPYSDENTGVVFPPSLGAFRKTEIRINGNPVIGTRIQYVGNRIGCSSDIYIYATEESPVVISEQEFQDHCMQVRRTILNLALLSKKIEETESLRQWRIQNPENISARRESFQIRTDGEETYHSDLVMILCGDRIVKLRITVPAAEKEALREAEIFIQEFCKLFFKNKPPVFVPIKAEPTETKPKKS